ncbi:hypothetical protein BDZ45DRAFT_752121 [Acephala macrosclerotiorum]|nr:hypothetical protein BDZ45DRAFT_752121 [Acephala macrosclerotiorum]
MVWFSNFWGRWTYGRVPLSVDEEDLKTSRIRAVQVRHEFSLAITMINLLLTILTITIVLLPERYQKYLGWAMSCNQPCNCATTTTTDRRYKNPKLNPDIKRVAGYSPLLDEVDLTPQSKVLNGAFHDNTTIYIQDPSPEVDEAWELFSGDIFLTSYLTVRDSGRSLSKSIHFPPSPDSQPGKYIATWDVFHQIHCLNWLRKFVNWEYYYGDNKPGPWIEGYDSRVDEVDIVGSSKSGSISEDNSVTGRINQAALPAANFNVHKMSRNFSALVEWAKKNKENDPAETRRRLTVPENAQLSNPEDY